MRALQIGEFGGPEVLRPVDVAPPVPRSGQVLVEVEAAGVNPGDTWGTGDGYLLPVSAPLVPGGEVVGRVVGTDPARRVVALLPAGGGYADLALAPEEAVFPVGEAITDGEALALVGHGATAWSALRTAGRIESGETVLVHPADAPVGGLALQLARQWGAARVVAAVAGAESAEMMRALGADAVLPAAVLTSDSAPEALREATEGRGVDVVVAADTGTHLSALIDVLTPFGRLVLHRAAYPSPAAGPVGAAGLVASSRSVSGVNLLHALRRRPGLGTAVEELVSLVRAGRLRPVVAGSYPLHRAARAHEDLAGAATPGKVLLDLRADRAVRLPGGPDRIDVDGAPAREAGRAPR